MINIDIELYKIFYEVALAGNITKAAKSLYISQPAVTMSIKKLENQLETTLFSRTKKGVILTNEGKVLYEYVKQAMENISLGENKIENFKKLESGNITVGISTSLTKYFLINYLEKFHKLYPKIAINVDTSITSETLKNLQDDKIDIAIITGSTENYKKYNIVYSKDIQDIFIANNDFSDILNKKLSLEELSKFPLLLQSKNSNARNFLNDFTSKSNITLDSIMDLASYSLIIEFAKIGMGIGFVTKDYVKNELNNKSLFEIKTNFEIPKRQILVLTKKGYLPSFSASKLIDIINK